MDKDIPVYKNAQSIFVPVPANYLGDFLDLHILRQAPSLKMKIVFNDQSLYYDYDGLCFEKYENDGKHRRYSNKRMTTQEFSNYIKRIKTPNKIVIHPKKDCKGIVINVGFNYVNDNFNLIGYLNKLNLYAI